MRYLVIYNEDKLQGFESRGEAIEFCEDKLQSNINDYCDDYDIDIEDVSLEKFNGIVFGAGYESGDIKIYNINKILKNIDKANLDEDEKEELIQSLKSDFSDTTLGDYEGLEEILEYVNEEEVY